jgi:hypothetical protein
MSVLGLFRLLFERDPYKGAFGPVARGRDPVVGGKITWLPPYECASLDEFLRGVGIPSAMGIPKIYLTARAYTNQAAAAFMQQRQAKIVGAFNDYQTDFDFLWTDSIGPCQAVFTYDNGTGGMFHRNSDFHLTRVTVARPEWVVLACRSEQTLASVDHPTMAAKQNATKDAALAKWGDLPQTVIYATTHNLRHYGAVFDVRGMRILLYPDADGVVFSPDARRDW